MSGPRLMRRLIQLLLAITPLTATRTLTPSDAVTATLTIGQPGSGGCGGSGGGTPAGLDPLQKVRVAAVEIIEIGHSCR